MTSAEVQQQTLVRMPEREVSFGWFFLQLDTTARVSRSRCSPVYVGSAEMVTVSSFFRFQVKFVIAIELALQGGTVSA